MANRSVHLKNNISKIYNIKKNDNEPGVLFTRFTYLFFIKNKKNNWRGSAAKIKEKSVKKERVKQRLMGMLNGEGIPV